ncbi:casein kinase ii regulatory subunit protein [Cardiosporidium cionae]|uniref:Casein kinase II subunit beta n=1 Tax=Cardiosporidium cionae TaxID=476202 RepID=A0ABQ7JGC8_9APIC|nr:casein kinase ii regulatory subunit protein [Cardiosporidium cionae]|eukprot:KAF8822994.1 casein kinase ii regulatory subunit protein [Cardiosporidium cionae]
MGDWSSDGSSSDGGWILWHCKAEGHSFLAEIDYDYASDSFNYYGLRSRIPNFSEAASMLIGGIPKERELKRESYRDLLKKAVDLYSLLHARFITSPKGLQQMRNKFRLGVYGCCPRVLCNNEPLLPIGLSEDLHMHRVRGYCSCCQEIYNIHEGIRNLDGASFGMSFPHIFLQSHSDLLCLKPPIPYVPKIYGFRLHNVKSIIQLKLENVSPFFCRYVDKGEYGTSCIPKDHVVDYSEHPIGSDDYSARLSAASLPREDDNEEA